MRNTIKQKSLKAKTDNLSIPNKVDANIKPITSFPTDINFDLYYHLKYNIKNAEVKCELHDSDLTTYCLPCRRAICDVCLETYHSSHLKITKQDISVSSDYVKSLFKGLENTLKKTEDIVQPDKLVKQIKTRTEQEFLEIEIKLNELKSKRMREIESMFSNTVDDNNLLYKNLEKTKSSLINYINKYKEFVDFKGVPDDNNFLFLPLYDLLNEIFIKNSEYMNILEEMQNHFNKFNAQPEKKYLDILKSIEICLEKQKRTEISNANLQVIDAEDGSFNKRDEFKQKLAQQFSKLNEDLYSDIRCKVDKLSFHYENFKNFVFESVRKSGSLLEIDKAVKLFEEKTAKKINYSGNVSLKLSYSNKSKNKSTKYMNSKLNHSNEKNNDSIDSNNKESNGTDSISTPKTNKKATFKINKPPKTKLSGKSNNIKKLDNNLNKKNELAAINESEEKQNNIFDTENLDNININKENGIKQDDKKKDNEDQLNNSSLNNSLNDNENTNNKTQGLSGFNNDKDEIIVNIKENAKKFHKLNNKEMKKLNNMFKPKQQYLPNAKDLQTSMISNNTTKKTTRNNDKTIDSHATNITNLSTIQNNANNLNSENSNYLKLNQKILENMKEIEAQSQLIKSREDISLNLSIVRKYYAFNTLEYIGKNYITNSNKAVSSGNLFDMLKGESLRPEDYIRINEGTNEMLIYSREKRKMVKIKVPIDKKTFGTTKFALGCRYILNGGNVYISGGKDFFGEKNYFWSYNIRENRLIKLQDSKFTHAYHSIFYHDNLRALVLIGGESNGYCEMYDLYLNIWNPLPDMLVPRAKVNIYVDKIGMYVYAIFGIEGSINKKEFSDVIEVLNMMDMTNGWARIEYNKKCLVDLKKTDLKVFELTPDKLMFYGAIENRDNIHCHLIFDLRNFDMYQINVEDLEKIKVNRALPIDVNLSSITENIGKIMNSSTINTTNNSSKKEKQVKMLNI